MVSEEGEEHGTKSILTPRLDLTESEVLRQNQLEYIEFKKKMLRNFLPMLQIDYRPPSQWLRKFPGWEIFSAIDVNDVLMIMPHRGLLNPKDSQLIQVVFSPRLYINVKAILECEVLGGPPEYISITGQSSDLMYNLNTQKLNFKIRSFHEFATELLVITNIALLSFDYTTYLNEPVFANDLPGKIMDLVPPTKTLEPEEEASISVEVRPGVLGYFHRSFLLEIGYYPAMPIDVYGWGVIPQIYLCLPRPDMFELSLDLCYLSIATLTIDYLEAVQEIFTKGATEHLNTPLLDQCFEDRFFDKNEWHICSTLDEYPSIMDIELATERMLVINHIKSRPEIMNLYINGKTVPVPGFITTPYVIDFGVVITGTTVQKSVDVINYGPIQTKIHFSKGYSPKPWLLLKLCGKLEPGDKGKLEVVFWPTPYDFKELEQTVEYIFYLELKGPVKYPSSEVNE